MSQGDESKPNVQTDTENEIDILYPSEGSTSVVKCSEEEESDDETRTNQDCNGDSPVVGIAGTNPPPCTPLEGASRRANLECLELFKSWDALKKLLNTGGNEKLLWNKWWGMDNQQRQTMLYESCPTLDLTPVTYVEIYGEVSQLEFSQKKPKFRNVYVLPSINSSDLVHEMNLPLFIRTRGHHPPQYFVLLDHQLPAASSWTCVDREARSNGYYMPLRGTSAEEYGRVTTVTLGNIQYADALTILGIQNKMMVFLLHCAKSILRCKVDVHETNEAGPQELPPINNYMYESSEKSIAREAPYRLPSPAGFSFLLGESFVTAKNHLRNLRNHPSYFKNRVKECGRHSCELIQEEGRGIPNIKGVAWVWRGVVAELIQTAYQDYFYWRQLNSLLEHFTNAEQKWSDHGNRVYHGNPELLSSCREIERFLDLHMLPYQRSKARTYFASSTQMRPFFERQLERCGDFLVGYTILIRQGTVDTPHIQRELMYSYRIFAVTADMTPEDNSKETFRLTYISREVGRLVAAAAQSHSISPMAHRAFAELEITTELRNQLSTHRCANFIEVNENEDFVFQEEIQRGGDDSFEDDRNAMRNIITYLSWWRTRFSEGMPYMGLHSCKLCKNEQRPNSVCAKTEIPRSEREHHHFWDALDVATVSGIDGVAANKDPQEARDQFPISLDWVKLEQHEALQSASPSEASTQNTDEEEGGWTPDSSSGCDNPQSPHAEDNEEEDDEEEDNEEEENEEEENEEEGHGMPNTHLPEDPEHPLEQSLDDLTL